MGFFGDEDEAFDLFVLHELDKQNKKSGGCMLSLLLVLLMCVVLTLTACGKEQPDQKEESGKTAAEVEDSAEADEVPAAEGAVEEEAGHGKLLYMGHASIRIETPEGKVIYIDPYVGDGYDLAADLILVTHGHYDHNKMDLVANRNAGCQTITWKEALAGGKYRTFDLDYVTVEAVEAGYNTNHNVRECVGYVLTLSDGVTVYVSGDTSKTEQMPSLAEKKIDYAFFCCDGVYNMDLAEAAECAKIVGAKHNIPYHMVANADTYFDRQLAEQFEAPNRLIIGEGEEIELVSD